MKDGDGEPESIELKANRGQEKARVKCAHVSYMNDFTTPKQLVRRRPIRKIALL